MYVALWTLTLILRDVAQRAVDGGEVGLANIQKVRTHATHRHLGDVRERLADGAAKDEHPHLLVEGRNVGVSYKRLGSFVQEVDPVTLSDYDLKGQKLRFGMVGFMAQGT